AQCPPKGPRVALGIVGHADLSRGAAARETLEAQIAAGGGRFKGIRHTVAWDQDTSLMNPLSAGPPGLMSDMRFREGLAQLALLGLTFDAWLFHPQMDDLADLASAFPNTRIVLDHFGVLASAPIRAAATKSLRDGRNRSPVSPHAKTYSSSWAGLGCAS